jgi:PD-(D/E)XK endonuclease
MKKRRTKIIRDKKERGEWAESVFIARATEEGLPASKPWGDCRSYDCVVGRPGKFVAVQVKCTLFRNPEGEGYICSTSSSHKRYRPGAFDFLAAYVIPEDAWYIIPAKLIRRLKSISLCTVEAKYEEYREAWNLLRKASEIRVEPEKAGETAAEELPAFPPSSALGRMETALDYFKRRMERGSLQPRKEGK